MNLTAIVTQFALTVGASLAERLAAALSSRIKQEPETEANPVDIAIATKSAVSADREGKIASERAHCRHGKAGVMQASGGFLKNCPDCHLSAWGLTSEDANKMWETMVQSRSRRLGDYGPGGE